MPDNLYPLNLEDWPLEIDSSSQLFVDDYLIASQHGLKRVVHSAKKHPDNPLIEPDKPWETRDAYGSRVELYGAVMHDPAEGLYRMWYNAHDVCYAISADGITWEKPELGLFDHDESSNTNICYRAHKGYEYVDSVNIFHRPDEPDPEKRYAMLVFQYETEVRPGGMYLAYSPDGIHWTEGERPVIPGFSSKPKDPKVNREGVGDISQFIYDPKLGCYVGFLKILYHGKRVCALSTSEDIIHWTRPRMILLPDEDDPEDMDFYALSGFPYESMWMGFLRVYRAEEHETIDIQLVSSRDGLHWDRVGNRESIIERGSKGLFDWGMLSVVPSPPLLIDNEIHIYYSGLAGLHTNRHSRACIGLATLRRDRFVSLHAEKTMGELITRPLDFDGTNLHLNADADKGYIRVGVLDGNGGQIEGFKLDECVSLTEDSLNHRVAWRGSDGLRDLAGHTIRFKFQFSKADLYSFNIS